MGQRRSQDGQGNHKDTRCSTQMQREAVSDGKKRGNDFTQTYPGKTDKSSTEC